MVALATVAVAGVVALRQAGDDPPPVALPEGARTASTPASPVARGTDAAVGEGWIVQVLEYTPNANAAVGRARPSGGRQWVLVRALVVRRPDGRRIELALRAGTRTAPPEDCGDLGERGDDRPATLEAGAGFTVDVCFVASPGELDDALLLARDGGGGEAWLALS